MKKLEKEKDKSRWWQAIRAAAGKYSVKHGVQGFVVSLLDKTCSCKTWNLSGLPCAHARVAMREQRTKVEDYVHDYYSIEKYKKAYAYTINPINGRNLWEQVGVQIHPPEFKDTKKNLAFKRRPEEGESSCRKRCGMVSNV